MKKLLLTMGLLAAASAYSQTTEIPSNRPMEADLAWQLSHERATQPAVQPNEIRAKRFGYSGIAVQLAKTRNPLQLVNPAAPASYGPATQNLVRANTTRQSPGLKFFSFSF